jgi:hypothetical protein
VSITDHFNYWLFNKSYINIHQADVNPDDGAIYAVELGSAIIYSKSSFSEPFKYVDCCATAFTFVGRIRPRDFTWCFWTVDVFYLNLLWNIIKSILNIVEVASFWIQLEMIEQVKRNKIWVFPFQLKEIRYEYDRTS